MTLDESGYAAVAAAWGRPAAGVGRHDYGAAWLDKPPLLVAAFESAALGVGAVRFLGLVAALGVALGAAAVARQLVPEHTVAGPVAAALGAIFASCASLRGQYTEAELLADVAAVWSVALVLHGAQERDTYRRALLLFSGGALAAAALLTKQSFLDAGGVGVALLAFGAVRVWRVAARDVLTFTAGAFAAGLVVLGGAVVAGSSPGELGYALVTYRLTAGADAAGSSAGHLTDLVVAAGVSGLALVAGTGLVCLAARREMRSRWLLAGWLALVLIGVAAGGSYWHHYLLQLVPVTAVLGAVAVTYRRSTQVLVAVGAAAAVATTVAHATRATRVSSAATVGRYLSHRAYQGDSVVTLYTAPGVYASSGLSTPYPYYWGTMVDEVSGAPADLVDLLSSPRRPTFVVRWSDREDHGLRVSNEVHALLLRDYKLVATVCERKIYERRDVKRHVPTVPHCY